MKATPTSPRQCTVDGCERINYAREMCSMHYQRFTRTGSTEIAAPRKCSVDGCDRRHYSKGLCALHSQRMARNGTTDAWAGVSRSDPWERVLASSVEVESGCIEYQGRRGRFGYGMIRVGSRIDGTRRNERAHRVVWAHHNGPVPGGMVVRHTCDNPPCVNIDHLEIGTQADNMRDRMVRGRAAKKLTGNDATQIRARVTAGEPKTAVAKDFGVSPSSVRAIVEGKTFKWTA